MPYNALMKFLRIIDLKQYKSDSNYLEIESNTIFLLYVFLAVYL
jgi:hypothetical protein